MTLLKEAIYHALNIIGRDAYCGKIMAVINKHGLYPEKELVDSRSIAASINADIRNNDESEFIKINTGLYGLKKFSQLKRNIDKYKEIDTNIFITPKLIEELSSQNSSTFARNIEILLRFLENWEEKAFLKCTKKYDTDYEDYIKPSKTDMIDNLNRFLYISKYPIILGTKEEVIKRRKEIEGENEQLLKVHQMRLINLVSSSDACSRLGLIDYDMKMFQYLCRYNNRYAFYMSAQCSSEVLCHQVFAKSNPI